MIDLRANDYMWLRAAAMSQPGFAAGFAWSAAPMVYDRLQRRGLVDQTWAPSGGIDRDGSPHMRAQAITTPKGLQEIERRAALNVNRQSKGAA
jgi:hypothetical protein